MPCQVATCSNHADVSTHAQHARTHARPSTTINVHVVTRLGGASVRGTVGARAVAHFAVLAGVASPEVLAEACRVQLRDARTIVPAAVVPRAHLAVVTLEVRWFGVERQQRIPRAHDLRVVVAVAHGALVVGRHVGGGRRLRDDVALLVAVLHHRVSRVVEEAAALAAVGVAHGVVAHEVADVVPARQRVACQVIDVVVVGVGEVSHTLGHANAHVGHNHRGQGGSLGGGRRRRALDVGHDRLHTRPVEGVGGNERGVESQEHLRRRLTSRVLAGLVIDRQLGHRNLGHGTAAVHQVNRADDEALR